MGFISLRGHIYLAARGTTALVPVRRRFEFKILNADEKVLRSELVIVIN